MVDVVVTGGYRKLTIYLSTGKTDVGCGNGMEWNGSSQQYSIFNRSFHRALGECFCLSPNVVFVKHIM